MSSVFGHGRHKQTLYMALLINASEIPILMPVLHGRLQLSPREADAASPRAPLQGLGSGEGAPCAPGCWPSPPSRMAACRLFGLVDALGSATPVGPSGGPAAGAHVLSARFAGLRLDGGTLSAPEAADAHAGAPGGTGGVRARDDREALLLLQLLAALAPLSADERCSPRKPNSGGGIAAPLAPLLAAQLLAEASGRARMGPQARSCALALLHACAAQLQPAAAILPPAAPQQGPVTNPQTLAVASGAQALAHADALRPADEGAGLGLREGSGSCTPAQRRHVLVAAVARALEAALEGSKAYEGSQVSALHQVRQACSRGYKLWRACCMHAEALPACSSLACLESQLRTPALCRALALAFVPELQSCTHACSQTCKSALAMLTTKVVEGARHATAMPAVDATNACVYMR